MMRWLDRSGFGLLSPSLMLLLAAFLAPLAFLVPVSFGHMYQVAGSARA